MIQTERLVIKTFEIVDSENFFEGLKQNKNHLGIAFSNMLRTNATVDQTREYIIRKQEEAKNRSGFAFGIFTKGTLHLIGTISVRDIDWTIPKGEIAFFLFKDFTGQGFATEALMAFRNWCFDIHNFKRLFMRIAIDNIGSIKSAQKCGFQFEGTLRNDYRISDSELSDMNMYGYIKE
ncbi:MAG: GNAT family N-acetyltransferase [Chitinophagaceae bacterium]|nr:GNAT family N-acetyltransferase [Chitinophagaceae bacterium]